MPRPTPDPTSFGGHQMQMGGVAMRDDASPSFEEAGCESIEAHFSKVISMEQNVCHS